MNEIWTIERTPGANWIVESVRHLTGEENRGNHHVYVDAKGPDGADLRNTGLNIFYGWNGIRDDEATPLVPIDKPQGEFGCNVPIFRDTEMYVGMHGAPSDIVRGLRTNFGDADGEDGNSWGHQSFYVVFKYQQAQPRPKSLPQASGLLSPQPAQPQISGVVVAEPSTIEGWAIHQPDAQLEWEAYPAQAGTLAHHKAMIGDQKIAWVIQSSASNQVIAYLATLGGERLSNTQFFPSVERAKQWAEQEASQLLQHG